MDNVPYRLAPDERVIGSAKEIQRDKFDRLAREHTVGVGDLMASLTGSTGFKAWWKKLHKGECLPCKKRQAALNYLTFQGPEWLTAWVKEHKDKGD